MNGNALQWIDGRWHCDGVGIHAGDGMELHCPGEPVYHENGSVTYKSGTARWLPVRIESREQGAVLDAYTTIAGVEFRRVLDLGGVDSDRLRWPCATGRMGR